MHRTRQKRQPPLASVRAATGVAWEELCLWRHERLAAVRLLPQVCVGRRLVARTCGRPISCAGTPREERSWVSLYALRMRTTLWDQRRRRSASRQISCASRKPGRSPLCSSRAAGRARELALSSQRTVCVQRTVCEAEPARSPQATSIKLKIGPGAVPVPAAAPSSLPPRCLLNLAFIGVSRLKPRPNADSEPDFTVFPARLSERARRAKRLRGGHRPPTVRLDRAKKTCFQL